MTDNALLGSLPPETRATIFARARGRAVALPEAADARVTEAAALLSSEFGVRVFLPTEHDLRARSAETLAVMRAVALARGKDHSKVAEALGSDPFYVSGALLARGEVDAVVGGATVPTAHVIKAAIGTVGLEAGASLMTSAFLMALASPTAGGEGVLVYSDGAVIPQPTSAQLSDIAFLAARAYDAWTGREARVAFLSFSTAGSASHTDVSKVRTAWEAFRAAHPAIPSEGEVQFDAATVPSVAARKCPGSSVAGRANVLVFPDLDAGNIGYKITQRLAGAEAFGPVLLGAARPFSDLSRGATARDVVASALLTLALAGRASARPWP